jgi:hypothetical protein
VRNEELLPRVKEQRNILHEISKRRANWIGHILRRNCLLQQVFEENIKGGIEVTGRRGRRRRKLLDYLKERRGYSNLKEEALTLTEVLLPQLRFFHAFSSVVRQMPGCNSQRPGTARNSLFFFFLLLCMFRSLYSVYCLCVNVYCTAATGCQPNCS